MTQHIGIVACSAEGASLCHHDAISALPTLDSTRLLARAALRRAYDRA